MAEPFKNLFNEKIINSMGKHFTNAWAEFDCSSFVTMATNNLDALELKERSAQITEALVVFLPDDFEHAAAVMLKSLAPEDGYDININESDEGIVGWAIMPMVDYVGLNGLNHFDDFHGFI